MTKARHGALLATLAAATSGVACGVQTHRFCHGKHVAVLDGQRREAVAGHQEHLVLPEHVACPGVPPRTASVMQEAVTSTKGSWWRQHSGVPDSNVRTSVRSLKYSSTETNARHDTHTHGRTKPMNPYAKYTIYFLATWVRDCSAGSRPRHTPVPCKRKYRFSQLPVSVLTKSCVPSQGAKEAHRVLRLKYVPVAVHGRLASSTG